VVVYNLFGKQGGGDGASGQAAAEGRLELPFLGLLLQSL